MILTKRQKENITHCIKLKAYEVFKTDGNYKIYEKLNWSGCKGEYDNFNSMVYNQYSQLKQTGRDFNLYVGCTFKCDDFLNMGEYEKKLFLFRLKGRNDEKKQGTTSLKVLEKIQSYRDSYREKHNLLIETGYDYNFKYQYRIFTYTHFCDDEEEDEGLKLMSLVKFRRLIKFLHAAQYTMNFLNVENGKQKTFFEEILKTIDVEEKRIEFHNDIYKTSSECSICDMPLCSVCKNGEVNIFFSSPLVNICKKCCVLANIIHCPLKY